MDNLTPFNPYNRLPSQNLPWVISPDWWMNQFFLLITKTPKSEWRWTPGSTYLSTNFEVALGVAFYLVITLGGQQLMKQLGQPINPKKLVQVHNLMLSLSSAFILMGFMEQAVPILLTKGFFWSICDYYSYTQPMEWLYYVNYLFKWVEFIDTFFLVLKKKKLQVLHVYHHALTMALCYSQLVGKTSVSWVVCSINLLVHVVMYYYYYLASRGIYVKWKKYLTIFQITQFVVDIGLCYFCLYTHMAYHNFPWLPNMGDCRGTRQAAYIGCFLLSSYLFLFVQFFVEVYSEGAKREAKIRAEKRAARKTKNASGLKEE